MYGHMNNSIYNFLYDSVINAYLMQHCGFNPVRSSTYGVVVRSHSDYFRSVAFPAVVELALRVQQIGRTSVTYEIGLFEKDVAAVCAVGSFTHVGVDRQSGRPSPAGIDSNLRSGLEKIVVEPDDLSSKL